MEHFSYNLYEITTKVFDLLLYFPEQNQAAFIAIFSYIFQNRSCVVVPFVSVGESMLVLLITAIYHSC